MFFTKCTFSPSDKEAVSVHNEYYLTPYINSSTTCQLKQDDNLCASIYIQLSLLGVSPPFFGCFCWILTDKYLERVKRFIFLWQEAGWECYALSFSSSHQFWSAMMQGLFLPHYPQGATLVVKTTMHS